MGLLVMMCSRSDYVANSHHEKDVNYIMEEVQELILLDNDGNEFDVLLALCAVQAFANLIYHIEVHLGVSLNISLWLCIYLVSEWCRLCLWQGIIDEQVIPYLFYSVAALLVNHIEQTIAILSERGDHLINDAKCSYRAAKYIVRDALNEYFSAHL